MRSWRRVPLPPPVSRSASRSRRARRRRNVPQARPGRRRSCSTWACGPTRRRSRCARADDLYNAGKRGQAGAIFGRYGSLEAQVGHRTGGVAVRFRQPGGAGEGAPAERCRAAELRPRRSTGAARPRPRKPPGATRRRREPDTVYALRAEDLLYPNFPRGLPTFVPSFPAPAALDRLSPPRQLGYLQRLARTGGARGKLLYGVALQRLGRQLSALREFEAAAALAPGDPEPQVAAAVGRFDKADPSRTFSRLGPLAQRYPKSQSVRFHLGLCLLWLGSAHEGPRGAPARPRSGPEHAAGNGGPPFPRPAEQDQTAMRRRWAVRPMADVRRVWQSPAVLATRLTEQRSAASLSALTGGVERR